MLKKQKGGRPQIFDNSQKIAVATDYLTGNMSMSQVGKKHNLSASQVRWMVRWYEREYLNDQEQQQPEAVATDPTLARELHLAKLKIAGLEMMIEIARKELGVDIRKKPGAKQ